MKILLLEPKGNITLSKYSSGNVRIEPLGLEYIAAVLKNAFYSTDIIQQNDKDDHQLFNEIKEKNYNVVGISCMAYNYNTACKIAKMLKDHNSNIIIVFGGYYPTYNPEIVKEKYIDFVVRGEGEFTFLNLIRAIDEYTAYDNINGLAFHDRGFIINEIRRIKDLDSLPFPLREDIGKKEFISRSLHYPSIERRGITIQVLYSRGCPYNCAFCSSKSQWGNTIAWRSPINMVNELKKLYNEYNIKHFFFADMTFNYDSSKIYYLCKEILNNKIDISWFCQCRPMSNLTEDLLKTMISAGLEKIHLGIETVNEMTLNKINKKQSLENIIKITNLISSLGVLIKAYVMIGYPWDDSKSINLNLGILNNMNIDELRITFLTPFPGTSLYEKYDREGMLLTKNLDFYTSDIPIIKVPKVTTEELYQYRSKIFEQFYNSSVYQRRIEQKIKKFPRLKDSYLEFFKYLNKEFIIN